MNTVSRAVVAVAVVIITGFAAPPADKKIALQIDPNQLLTKNEPGVAPAPPKVAAAKPVDAPAPMPADPPACWRERPSRTPGRCRMRWPSSPPPAPTQRLARRIRWCSGSIRTNSRSAPMTMRMPSRPLRGRCAPHPPPPVAVASAAPDEVKPAFQGARWPTRARPSIRRTSTPPAIRMPTTPLRFFPAVLNRTNRESPNA